MNYELIIKEWCQASSPESIEGLKKQLQIYDKTGMCAITPPILGALHKFGILEKRTSAFKALQVITELEQEECNG